MDHDIRKSLEIKFQERYEKLNTEQKSAVDTIEGPVLVIAGPGSGKTELLSLRVCNILKLTDTLPSSILCLTFTDAAAINMKKRLASLIGQDAYRVAIHTFHSFGTEVINRNPEYFYEGAEYKAADQLTQYSIIENILKELPHSAQLSSYHPNQGYTYLSSIINKISELKKGGLGPKDFDEILEENKKFLEQANPLFSEIFNDRISKQTIGKIPELIAQLEKIPPAPRSFQLPYLTLQTILITSFKQAYAEATEGDKPNTKPITTWKNAATKKNSKKETVLVDQERLKKHEELAHIYTEYQTQLHLQGYFDFDDMLLDTTQALQNNPELKYNLQERYQYILVDEFQDTNGVQMRLLEQLLDAKINEGRPNILAVGDDDQAIYKFQGANIDNILSFPEKYREPVTIVLQKNYRSTQPILNFVRKIILTGTDRLETRLPDQMTKDLQAANLELKPGEILEKEFPTNLHELIWIAHHIKQKLETKECEPSEIAIIAPKHKLLEQAAKVLDYFGISVAYERKKDLLKQNHIAELVSMLHFINSIARHDQAEADEHLPTILSYPFWNLQTIEIWKISVKAHKDKKRWLEIMIESEDEKLQNIAQFFITLGILAKEKTAEEIIDLITGITIEKTADHLFQSPYKNFYFQASELQTTSLEYLDRLQSLQSFIQKLRGYKGIGVLTLNDAIEFLNLHEKHRLSLYYKSNFNIDETAVNLVTAHGAKGLEFENVYIINCEEEEWIKKGNLNKLTFPTNLPLAPENENADDQLRLFYVALTRAKRNLYLTRHQYTKEGNENLRLRFLENETNATEKKKKENISTATIDQLQSDLKGTEETAKLLELFSIIQKHEVRNTSQHELLKNLLNEYKLSVTHLNNFLDLTEGGPQTFIEKNLLRFPQKINSSGAYGSAIHQALNCLSFELKKTHILPPVEYLLQEFEKSLTSQRLNRLDDKKFRAKGLEHLKIYYEQRKDTFHEDDQAEFDFRRQGVVIGSGPYAAEITGKIDKMTFHPQAQEITVYDYKTGKALKDWDHGTEYQKIKSWKYRNQLIFYKLLVENARDFKSHYRVHTGYLEFIEPLDDKIQLLQLSITPEETEKMRKLIQVIYKKIMNLDFPDVSFYPQNLDGIKGFTEELLSEQI